MNCLHYIISTICSVGMSWDMDFSISVLRYDVMVYDGASDFGYSNFFQTHQFPRYVAGLFIGSINTTRLVTLSACKPVGACHIFTQRTQCSSCTMGVNTKSRSGTRPRMLLALLVCLYSWTQSGSTIQCRSDMCCGWVYSIHIWKTFMDHVDAISPWVHIDYNSPSPM